MAVLHVQADSRASRGRKLERELLAAFEQNWWLHDAARQYYGSATFDGGPDINPALDIRLSRQFPEAAVAIQITGTPRRPHLNMTSDPPIYERLSAEQELDCA